MNLSRFRTLIQLASSVFTNGYVGVFVTRAVNNNPLKGLCVPYLNCYACPSALFSCPIGTLQHFMAIRSVPFLLLGMLSTVGLTIGRMPCGWACPFGFLQDLLHKFPSPKFKVPRFLRPFKYGFLVIFALLLPYLTGDNWLSKICPAGTLIAGIPWVLWNPVSPDTGLPVLPNPPGLQFLAVVISLCCFLVWFVLSKRPFCQAVCPMGAILSLFNRASLIRLEVADDCDACNFCNVNCPMDLKVPLEINSRECIRCLECTRCGHVKVTNLFASGDSCDERI